jgi:hypothetical protein
MKASMLDATAIRPRVWTKLLMVVAVAPAATRDGTTPQVPTEHVVVRPPPRPEPPPPPPPTPRQLPTGSPACGNVTSRAPAPQACAPAVDEDPCARPRVMASGAPACGNVTARPLPGRGESRRRR